MAAFLDDGDIEFGDDTHPYSITLPMPSGTSNGNTLLAVIAVKADDPGDLPDIEVTASELDWQAGSFPGIGDEWSLWAFQQQVDGATDTTFNVNGPGGSIAAGKLWAFTGTAGADLLFAVAYDDGAALTSPEDGNASLVVILATDAPDTDTTITTGISGDTPVELTQDHANPGGLGRLKAVMADPDDPDANETWEHALDPSGDSSGWLVVTAVFAAGSDFVTVEEGWGILWGGDEPVGG